jgi:acyl-CoA thioesterase FadM
MARIQLQLPDQFTFSTALPLRITDLNYGGHVGNDTILTLLHEARVRFLHHFGYTELAFDGVSLIMADAGIEFKSELFYGDELTALVAPHDGSRVGFDIYYKLVKGPAQAVVALAKTGMVCFDYTTKKVVRLPEGAREKLFG